jgi:LuxR family maltose regulon positive regulatory protein
VPAPILATKLYIPPPRLKVVIRPRLAERLDESLHHKLTLISAPAGFGKTTLVSEWVAGCQRPAAWLSLDEGDNDLARFLTYLVAALRTVAPNIGAEALGLLQSPQPPPGEPVLTILLNEIAALPDDFVLVLDDYHVIDARSVDHALTFLLEHLPPTMHLLIATREDPRLPFAQLRARDQLTELRVADLRFTPSEATQFLNQVIGLGLSAENIAALEARTEGWIAGLQLAALALQGTASTPGQRDATDFIKSFTGSHRFVMDYLVEQVLQQQPASVQAFLLRTSILDRLCGPLCDALLENRDWGLEVQQPPISDSQSPISGQQMLEQLERSNLFIIPLDNERGWYRYHHLFADLLRQRLHRDIAASAGDEGKGVAELHVRASQWYEDNSLEIEAFHHAVAANDIERAARLVEGKGMPLQFRGALADVLHWLASLPAAVLDARPSLWVMYASALSMTGKLAGVEEKLQAAEAALQGVEQDAKTRNLIGHIAAIRALLAAAQNQVEVSIAQSHRALEYLHPNNLAVRTATVWKLGIAYHLRGERAAARQAYSEAMSISQASGNLVIYLSAAIGLGAMQEGDTQLHQAAETYQHILQLQGDQPGQVVNDAHLGLARIFYEWNDLASADQHERRGFLSAEQYEQAFDRYINSQIFLARLRLAREDMAGASDVLEQTSQFARQRHYAHGIPEVAAAQVLTFLRQGNLADAARLAQIHNLPLSQARVYLAQGDASAALAVLAPVRQQMEAKGWQDERLKVMVLQTVALHLHGERDRAAQVLAEALALAEPGGFIRTFLDEGVPMAALLTKMEDGEMGESPHVKEYIRQLLIAFGRQEEAHPSSSAQNQPSPLHPQPLVEPLSQRELEILKLIAQGLSNRQIGERLFLALSTVKGHIRIIFDKLQVQNRTEAVARARELGLL